jgi:hypothetical protein
VRSSAVRLLIVAATGAATCVATVAACSLTSDLNGLSSGSSGALPGEGGIGQDGSSSSGGLPDGSVAPDGGDGGTGPIVPQTGWKFRKKLSIVQSLIPIGATLDQFPIVVRLEDPDLRSTINGGKLQAGGVDLAFFGDDGKATFAFEVESYNAEKGALIAWVKIPSLSRTTNTTFYLNIVNADVKSSLANPTSVWANGYAGVWHMNDSNWLDSTSGTRGTPAGTDTQITESGKIGLGGSFGANSSNVDVGTNAKYRPSSITVSVWAQPKSVNTAPDRHPYMAFQDVYRNPGSDPRGYYIEIFRTQSNPIPTFYTGNSATIAHAFATTKVVNDVWYLITGTRDETTGFTRVYVNAKEEGNASMTGAIQYLPAKPLLLGGTGIETWNGLLDELHISNVARSPAWIETEHNNQSSPASFLTAGPTEPIN